MSNHKLSAPPWLIKTFKSKKSEKAKVEQKEQSTATEPYPDTSTNFDAENLKLCEENNLLKLKVEILLDMLAETTAEMHLQEKEIDRLQEMLDQKQDK